LRWPAARALVAAVAAVAAVATLAACTGSPAADTPASDALRSSVLNLPAGAYAPGPAGPVDASAAEQATVVEPDAMRRFIDGHPLRAGYSRVWTYQDSYLTSVALGFARPADAQGLVTTAIAGVKAALGTYLAPLPGVAGGQLYDLSGQQRVGGHYLFCSGAWFAVAAVAYTVTECSKARPVGIDAVVPYARLQYQQATNPAH
jgi:hypothetical protein